MSSGEATVGEADRWRGLILAEIERRPVPVVARTALAEFGGVSDAVAIDCDDGRRYVVKGHQMGRALVADHVVGRLGAMIGAPVAEVTLVDVPATLVVESSYLEPFEVGIGHGSLFIPDCRDSRDVTFEYEAENEERFALLAVLYGWTSADDRQFLYRKSPPHLVYSVDHGHFLVGGPDWTVATLTDATVAEPDTWITVQARTGAQALQAALEQLQAVTHADIAAAVAVPPDSWGITLDERVALAHYLARRRDDLLARLPATGRRT